MSKNKNKGLGKFVLGATIGAGLGILFAPKKGSETRKDLKVKFDNMVTAIKEIDVEEVKEDLENKIADLKEEIENLNKEKVLKIAKEKAEIIKDKAQELVDLAVKKGTPVVEKAAKEVKDKAIVVVKEVLERLEK